MARGLRCKAHKHTSIVAEENHHLQPQSRGGRTVVANMRYLCANAHGDVHYLLDLIEDAATPMIGRSVEVLWPYETIPWPQRRTFGPGIRDAALTGWMRYGRAFLAGDFVRHAALWTTSGQPRTVETFMPTWIPGPPPPFAEADRTGVVQSWLDAIDRGLARGLSL
jgi:hypothetical protein